MTKIFKTVPQRNWTIKRTKYPNMNEYQDAVWQYLLDHVIVDRAGNYKVYLSFTKRDDVMPNILARYYQLYRKQDPEVLHAMRQTRLEDLRRIREKRKKTGPLVRKGRLILVKIATKLRKWLQAAEDWLVHDAPF